MRSDLNTEIMKPHEILDWVEPETDDEKVLFAALKQIIEDVDQEQEEICDGFKKEIEELNEQISEQDAQIEDLNKENDQLTERISELEAELQQIDQQVIN